VTERIAHAGKQYVLYGRDAKQVARFGLAISS
jgi:hypothetical protein